MTHKQREREFWQWCGLTIGASLAGSFGFVAAMLYSAPHIAVPMIFCGLAAPLIANAVLKGENVLMRNILKALGITDLNMKLEALAKHFKLRFVHIPEHYKCESTE